MLRFKCHIYLSDETRFSRSLRLFPALFDAAKGGTNLFIIIKSSDKAISVTRSALHCSWDKTTQDNFRSIGLDRSRPNWTNIIIPCLSRPDMSHLADLLFNMLSTAFIVCSSSNKIIFPHANASRKSGGCCQRHEGFIVGIDHPVKDTEGREWTLINPSYPFKKLIR